MKERSWRTAAVAGALLLVMAGAWGVSQYNARKSTETQLAANYQERFFEAVGHVENVEVLLTKGMLIASAAKAQASLSLTVFSDIWRQAFAAQANLTQLPLLQGTLMRTSKFLTQVGDFGYSMGKKLAAGGKPTMEDQEKIAEFQKEASTLNASLRSIQTSTSAGQMPWVEIQRVSNNRLRDDSKELADSDFVRLEKQAAEFPTIIYDGPFSDHITTRNPKGLTGPMVSEGEAEEIALKMAVDAELPDDLVAEVIGMAEGDMPAYQVRLRRPGRTDEVARLDISRKGGHVIWMLVRSDTTNVTLTMENAARSAKDFLVRRGFQHVIPTYANEANGQAIIPFAPLQDGVIIYPDLLKVTVSMSTGQIIGYEAMGYLMEHHTRKLAKPVTTPQQALQAVSSQLKVSGKPQLALIPTETLQEVLTYEIKGSLGNTFFVNYVNARTGDLERILQILDTPEGQQAM